MKRFKVYYEPVNPKSYEIQKDTIHADGFNIERGVLVFFNRYGGTTNTHAYKEWLRVYETDE